MTTATADFNVWTITTGSDASYAEIAVVAHDEKERDALVAAFEAESEKEEAEALGEEVEFGHDADDFAMIDEDDMDDETGLTVNPDGEWVNLTWRALAAKGAGVTLLKSGLNG